MVVVAAMPSASVATATAATPRIRDRLRTLYRRSFTAIEDAGQVSLLTARRLNRPHVRIVPARAEGINAA
jgi:hypothetical protein